MTSLKELKHEEKMAAEQRALISELNNMLRDIERCERTIADLKGELDRATAEHQGPRNTREDIVYLTKLLSCAKKKLAWEKQLQSLQKRTPAALEQMAKLMNDPQKPPNETVRAEMLRVLQAIQAAMERLQKVAG